MAAVIFVEVLDRLGRVQRRQRFDRFPITIGRAYSNDVILVDRHVSPEHLIVRQTEQGLLIEDRDSLNGLFPQGSRHPVRSLALVPGTELRIGHTRLRFCTPDQPVAPTIPRAAGGLAALVANNWVRAACLVGAAVAYLGYEYLGSYTPVELSDVVAILTTVVVSLFVWAGLWAIGTRLAVQEFHLIEHMTVAALAAVALVLVDVIFGYLGFFLTSGPLVDTTAWIIRGGVFVGLLYGHLTVTTTMMPARRLRIAVGVVAAFFALWAVGWIGERDDFSAHPHYPSELKPLGAGWIPKRSPAEFFEETGALEERLEDRAEIEKDPA